MIGGALGSGEFVAPSISRRLMCFIYEGVVLFGVVMLAGFVYSIAMQQRHALIGTTGLQAFILSVLALYFTWFWSHGGQTVAMKTWRIRVLTTNGKPLSAARALARFVTGWLWLAPALAIIHLAGLRHLGSILGTLAAGILVFAALARVHPRRQFLHDAACGTCLVNCPALIRPSS